MSFENKIVLITGGNSGIGAACAEYFSLQGAKLALVGRNEEKFTTLLEKLRENGIEDEPLVIIADVTVDAERIISETIKKYGRLDILLNNAGFSIPGTIETVELDDYDGMMATNVRAVVEITQRAVPYLAETKGNIVCTSSIAGITVIPNFLAYCMTKAALDQFTKCTAVDLAPKGIRVNSINSGFIDTDVHSVAYGIERGSEEYTQFIEKMKQMYPLQRVGYTDDAVNAISFLADERSRYITGTLLILDGGLFAKGPF